MNLPASFRLIAVAVVLSLLGACAAVPPATQAPAAAATDTAASAAPAPAAREPDELIAHEPLFATANVAHVIVPEAFVTAETPKDNIDSPASWRAPDGRLWLFATAKEGGGLVIYDGDTGTTLRTAGSLGDMPGQFRRPNGIAVAGNRLYVVERDNRRVQVFALPDLLPLIMFGNEQLQQPYGLWVREFAADDVEVIITDAYMAGERANGDDVPPPLPELGRRMQRYRLTFSKELTEAKHVGAFGDTTAAGAIRIPESIVGDIAHDRLLISEEDTRTGTAVREYDLAGKYRGRTIGLGTFKAQAEGIALWQCPDGSGYWLMTDQFKDRSVFHVYDRETFEPAGAFVGNTVANTDGVWLHQGATTRFPDGVFYAVHDDRAVGAFDWRDIARALKLHERCD